MIINNLLHKIPRFSKPASLDEYMEIKDVLFFVFKVQYSPVTEVQYSPIAKVAKVLQGGKEKQNVSLCTH